MEIIGQWETLDRLTSACPRCKTKLEPIEPDTDPTVLSQTGWACPQCGWSVVATFIPPLLADEARYDIVVHQTHDPSTVLLKTLAKHLAVGLLQAKQTIQETDVCLFNGSALDVYRLRQELQALGVDCVISPEFPY
jgi:uncharacterized protein YbaR (Trm112 family)